MCPAATHAALQPACGAAQALQFGSLGGTVHEQQSLGWVLLGAAHVPHIVRPSAREHARSHPLGAH
eukprot:m.309935 g.309935  ORF g.309935 m.309935 type:complete len:66 (+) comp19646_c0_seq3:1777-1974(+)